MAIIENIRVTPTQPRPGEPVFIEVLGGDGEPLSAKRARVHVGPIPGARAHTQYAVAGEHDVQVTADAADQYAGAPRERRTVTVTVTGEPLVLNTAAGKTMPILRASAVPHDPYTVAFALGTAAEKKPPVGLSGNGVGGIFTGMWASTLATSACSNMAGSTRLPTSTALSPTAGTLAMAPRKIPRRPSSEHDYLAAVTPDDPTLVFTVTCTPLRKGGSPHPIGPITRTLVFDSAYGLLRKRGMLHPPVRGSSESATKREATYHAGLTVHNIEREALHLTHQLVTPVGGAADALHPFDVRPLAEPVVIGPGATGRLIARVPTNKVPPGSTSLEIRYAGKSDSGLPVRIATVVDLPARDLPRPIRLAPIDPTTGGGTVTLLVENGASCDPENISPEDASEAQRDGFACQLTDEVEERDLPARFVNARKGDIILSPAATA